MVKKEFRNVMKSRNDRELNMAMIGYIYILKLMTLMYIYFTIC